MLFFVFGNNILWPVFNPTLNTKTIRVLTLNQVSQQCFPKWTNREILIRNIMFHVRFDNSLKCNRILL